jgi:hypothetical protein
MPKLSADSLEKRFACPYCEKTLRTRQGLSGHIKFKHGSAYQPQTYIPYGVTAKEKPPLGLDEVEPVTKIWEGREKFMLDSQWEIHAQRNVLKRWNEVRLLCNELNIHLDKTDLKNYLVTSLAYVYTSECLKEEMIRILKQLIHDSKQNQSDS